MLETLETPRLYLRKMTVADTNEVFENWTSSENVAKYLTWAPHTSIEVTKEYLTAEEENRDEGWGIVLKETGQLIGNIAVIEDKRKIKTKILGYVLGEKFWNHGYMSEALFKVIDFLFETTDVNRIEAEHDTKNPNSGKVMAKAGMTFEGVLREAGYNNQGIVDVAYYSILRSDRKA
ncbi:GNAT family N-acetyltransferase [Vagococcus fluvialis]|uniref:GNAT family N-acetyltransferase n=1 Tax=Vagococcus fluvialis TaxID=2738 RepID=UPI001A8EEA92|nr:GNAT family protein [Vagococcus fluvialis]MBO0442741.1 GNAT family N-acetyltransferase [Vagococcus fluvialis]MCM2139062.1 GNAT family N-acetyltransferase [Vagococcus fluvialis]